MNETLTAVAAALGGGLVTFAPVVIVWLRSRGASRRRVARRADARDTAREDRVEHLEAALDQQRRELAALVALRLDDNERCADMLAAAIAAAKAECAQQIAAVEARADRLVEELVASLRKSGSVREDDTGVHHVEETIRRGRQRRTTPPQWTAESESGGER